VSALLNPALPFPAALPDRASDPRPAPAAWPGARADRPTALRPRPTEREAPELVAAEVALVRRMAAGEGEALAALYDRHAPLVLGLLVRIVGDRSEAEEILQEVFLQAWREAGRFRAELAPPRGWLLLLARSRALDRLKSDGARRRREETAARLDGAAPVAPEGSARLERLERRRRVRSALVHLPREQREAVELAFFAGLTHSQISVRLGLPLGTVKSRVLLGMRKLKQILEAA
jgi:RNA polymerase sigma-70 factor (ECF subfamily)